MTEHCYHCGAPREFADEDHDKDWFCDSCERWQDTIGCPTCHQPTRASLLDPSVVPSPAKAKKGGSD